MSKRSQRDRRLARGLRETLEALEDGRLKVGGRGEDGKHDRETTAARLRERIARLEGTT